MLIVIKNVIILLSLLFCGLALPSSEFLVLAFICNVMIDGQISLNKRAELRIEDHGVGFTIPDELLFQAEPERAGRGLQHRGDLDKVRSDRAVEPRPDSAIHAPPV
jgi:hypothetical protein